MPSNGSLSVAGRLELIRALNGLPDVQFKELIFALNPPSGILPGDSASQGDRVYALLQWVENSGPGLAQLREILNQVLGETPEPPQPLIGRSPNLPTEDWTLLFALFGPADSAYLQIAFRQAFKALYGHSFQKIRPDCPSLSHPEEILELLAQFDDPRLAVRFIEFALIELQRFSEADNRLFTALEAWRDRIAKQHRVDLHVSETSSPTVPRHAYLLIAIEEHGSDVNIYPELRITGAEHPLGFGATPTTCPVEAVANHISEWIRLAEVALETDACDDGEVTLEVFLPCQYLDEDIAAAWRVTDKRGDEIPLGTYRRVLTRSSDRIRDRQIQKALQRRWAVLEACVERKIAHHKFHLQEDCPQAKGVLCAQLKDREALGLKFVAQLPADPGKRIDLLYDIIDAAIPIALWSSGSTKHRVEFDAASLNAEFDALLSACHLTNFADLAKQWRWRRMTSASAKPIRLLCDRPDRQPNLPDPNQEDDLLVAF